MARDILYYFDKNSPRTRHELGEIQCDFNMSLTLDGTKDSWSIIVYSFNETELETNTVCLHPATKTWWIVSHDKVVRYFNENDEPLYQHNIELEGAIELLNARDLIDIGFNDNTYTISDFITRLINLSNCESILKSVSIRTLGSVDLNTKVDYVKTFENYTVLSALREFLDGYNCAAKLSFDEDEGTLRYPKLTIISKSGNTNLETLDDSVFTDIREIKTIDKESYGSTVVSNANNVISTGAKIYPSLGTVRISGTEYRTSSSNACIRLPSNAYKVNWVKMYANNVYLDLYDGTNGTHTTIKVNTSSRKAIQESILKVANIQNLPSDIYDTLIDNIETFTNRLDLVSSMTLYDGSQYDAINDTFSMPVNNEGKYVAKFLNTFDTEYSYVLMDKDHRDLLKHPEQGMYWERGSNLIRGFNFFGWITTTSPLAGSQCDTTTDRTNYGHFGDGGSLTFYSGVPSGHSYTWEVNVVFRDNGNTQKIIFDLEKGNFVINYIPMSDLKVKVNNHLRNRDMHIYNQTGKLTDSSALSKLLNSYSQEISANNITKYAQYYDFESIPQIGQSVVIDNVLYIINNVSIDFVQNESATDVVSYFMDCEFTLSKQVAVKSLMVNAYSNIRDYGIPQTNLVKRKETFRDLFVLSTENLPNTDNNAYLYLDEFLNFSNYSYSDKNYIAVIKIDYSNPIIENDPTSDTFYYQLESVTFTLKKQKIVMVDFKDNNIIGYSAQNMWSGFDITNLGNQFANVNTPISYVDNNGRFRGITLLFANESQVEEVYGSWQESHGVSSSVAYYNATCFINEELYNLFNNNKYDFRIRDLSYLKDALEVPFFEYCQQVIGDENVIVSNDIFYQDQLDVDECYLYTYEIVADRKVTELNALSFFNQQISNGSTASYDYGRLDRGVGISVSKNDKKLYLYLYNFIQYQNDGDVTTSASQNPNTVYGDDGTTDIVIYRHRVKVNRGGAFDTFTLVKTDFLFSAHNLTSNNLKTLRIELDINHYSLNDIEE